MGCVRLVYNKALAARSQAGKEQQEKVGYGETSKMLTQWKKEEALQFLGEVSAVPLQQGLRHLDEGYTHFFTGRAKYPRFKKKRNGGSAEFTKAAFRWRDGSLYLAKCKEPLEIRWSRQLPKGAEPSTVTVRLEPSGRWHVSILVNDDTVKPLPLSEKSVGVDVGIAHLAITSDGEKVENPRLYSEQRAASSEQCPLLTVGCSLLTEKAVGHTVTACGASVRLERHCSGEQLRKTLSIVEGERSRNPNCEVWESPSFQSGEDVKNAQSTWYIIKRESGHCDICEVDRRDEADVVQQWGPFPSQQDAIARRIGLIRSGKCLPK